MYDLERVERLQSHIGGAYIRELRAVRETEQKRLYESVVAGGALEAAVALNGLHDMIVSRALHMAENELARRGLGVPPVPYAYLLFGSGGRLEMTFASDQDSGIVYADPASSDDAEACRAYFLKLGGAVVQTLAELGYPPCDGNVLASNPNWCRPLSEWEAVLDRWFEDPTWEHVRYLLILADGRPAAGDLQLSARLQNRYFNDMLQSSLMVRRMVENTLRHKPLIGLFGQLLVERYGEHAGTLDIKYGAYIPLVNVMRLLAVQNGIRDTTTLSRIAALKARGVLTPNEQRQAVAAFSLFLKLRLLSVIKNGHDQWIGTGKISKSYLTGELVRELKPALKFCRMMQQRVERHLQDRFDGG